MRDALQREQRRMCLRVPELSVVQHQRHHLRLLPRSIVFQHLHSRLRPSPLPKTRLQRQRLRILPDRKPMLCLRRGLLPQPHKPHLHLEQLFKPGPGKLFNLRLHRVPVPRMQRRVHGRQPSGRRKMRPHQPRLHLQHLRLRCLQFHQQLDMRGLPTHLLREWHHPMPAQHLQHRQLLPVPAEQHLLPMHHRVLPHRQFEQPAILPTHRQQPHQLRWNHHQLRHVRRQPGQQQQPELLRTVQ